LGGWDHWHWGSKSAWENSCWDHISKITRARWTRGVAQPALQGRSPEFKLQFCQKRKKRFFWKRWRGKLQSTKDFWELTGWRQERVSVVVFP
jgi:hypothetical protein